MDILYRPSKWGAEFHALDHDEALGAGAAGPGKTTVLLAEPLYQVAVEHARMTDRDHLHPIERGASVGWALYMRRTFPQLQQVISRCRRMFRQLDPGVTFSVKESTFTFTSGYRYQFGQVQHTNDWENYFSNEYTHISFDELVAFEEEQYDQISTRCRTVDPVLLPMLKVRAMSNPLMRQEEGAKVTVADPHWVRRRFVDPAPMGRVTLKRELEMEDGSTEVHRMIYLPAKLKDNPNPDFVRQYERKLRSKKAHIIKAMLEGDWYSVIGGFYADSWDPSMHVCKPFRIPDDWPQFRAMDWGFKTYGTIGWFAMDPDDNLWLHRELSFKGMDARKVALLAREQEKKLGLWSGGRSRIAGVADTQLWEMRGNVGKSKAAEFQAVGIPWIGADKKSREANAERIVSRLNDHSNGTDTPGLVVFSSCHKTIQTIPMMQTSKDNPEEPAKNAADHWHDMLMYACAFASNGQAAIPMRSKHHNRSREAFAEEADRGALGYGSSL
jgi:hypothetical protein